MRNEEQRVTAAVKRIAEPELRMKTNSVATMPCFSDGQNSVTIALPIIRTYKTRSREREKVLHSVDDPIEGR